VQEYNRPSLEELLDEPNITIDAPDTSGAVSSVDDDYQHLDNEAISEVVLTLGNEVTVTQPGVHKTPRMLEIEKAYGTDIFEVLQKLQGDVRMTTSAASEILGIDRHTYRIWLRKFNIDPRGKKSDEKTPGMLVIEDKFGEDIETLLTRLAQGEHMIDVQIAYLLHISPWTVCNWRNRFNIAPAPFIPPVPNLSPEVEQARADRMTEMWRTRKDEMVEKIHTPESARKRSETIKKQYADPVERQKYEAGFQTRQELFAVRTELAHIQAFGEDVRQGLDAMLNIHHMTIGEIVETTGIPERQIEGLIDEHNIPFTPKTDKRAIRKFQEVQSLLWQRPERFQELEDSEKKIIQGKFMTDRAIPTNDEMTTEMGVSRQRVHQLESRAIKKLGNNSSDTK
jgi:DNA-directed RNA polymerase specialized sigma subunit